MPRYKSKPPVDTGVRYLLQVRPRLLGTHPLGRHTPVGGVEKGG